MNKIALKSYLKSVFVTIAEVLFLSTIASLILFLVMSVYFFGYLKGYATGADLASQNGNLTIKAEQKMEASASIDPTATPAVKKVNQTYSRKVTWGGPELWDAVNKRRQELGVNPLSLRTDLCTIASIRLNELLELGKLDGHVGFSSMAADRPDLKWIFDKYGTMAEFLAVGGDTPVATIALWENTLGHKKLLDGGEYVWGCIYSQNSFAVAIAAY